MAITALSCRRGRKIIGPRPAELDRRISGPPNSRPPASSATPRRWPAPPHRNPPAAPATTARSAAPGYTGIAHSRWAGPVEDGHVPAEHGHVEQIGAGSKATTSMKRQIRRPSGQPRRIPPSAPGLPARGHHQAEQAEQPGQQARPGRPEAAPGQARISPHSARPRAAGKVFAHLAPLVVRLEKRTRPSQATTRVLAGLVWRANSRALERTPTTAS